jgi:hypothetical protein
MSMPPFFLMEFDPLGNAGVVIGDQFVNAVAKRVISLNFNYIVVRLNSIQFFDAG